MLNTLSPITEDLAGQSYPSPHYLQTQRRIRSLIDKYIAVEKLHERLQDLPIQFANPQPRPWKPIDWQTINRNQIIGLDAEVFLSILIGAMDTEAPIRGYTQTSRQYLEKLHPQMARFVGGTVNEDGELLELGLWEKEERQHTPALIKVYTQLTGEKITPKLRTVRSYLPTDDAHEDLYRHGLHRIATEYGATCLYIWLMAHTTGALQDVLEELAQDEINHTTKFWGFGVWTFPDTGLMRIGRTLIKTRSQNYQRNNLMRTLRRMMATLNWNAWSLTNKATLLFTFTYTMRRLWSWNNTLTPQYLQNLFETN
ncbi:ferritin-like domain-containing protein [Nostoc sp. UCD121]|uniref:ferritin-like domain-containing protein n=1 Tax=unclassified Nostoc TaxID=2593658 RepID=UPI001626C0A8|nr:MULTISPECIES: ferritin-like domain-containing protein [unclassified Nostoc]MBC1222270.1 ferritin-like domain-containing protein [Nostoc sp. UCD120]MBC1280507.1 ferritin-like domain-containing protein [Nostoc sp. UCD121]MBC1297878.1 ferritin-like domain-containing protein [Nostoc sp. UCD122]